MHGRTLPAGKLPAPLLAPFLQALSIDGDVVVGAQYGEDAAVVQVGDRCLVVAMDPVTLSAEPGRIAVQVNANDVAVMGAIPRWLLASIILPADTTEERMRAVLEDVRENCSQIGVSLIGGHTEVSAGVSQPVVVGCMIGEVERDRLVLGSGAEPGDCLLLAGPIAVEGTGILAREHARALQERGVPTRAIAGGAALLHDPGISVLPAVRALLGETRPHAMHDPTEGGLLAAVRELAAVAGAGARLEADLVPIFPECRTICRALDLDPLRLLASGSLLVALAPRDLTVAQGALAGAGIESACIGTILPAEEGMWLARDGSQAPLPEVERDELARWAGS